MKIEPFKLERYFAQYEFCTRYLLSSSDCDGYSLEYILESADAGERKRWEGLTFGYTDSAGSPFLREAIAAQYRTIHPDELVVCSPGEASFSLMNVLLEPGDEVVCMGPSYQSLYQVALSLGAVVRFWQPSEKNHAYEVEALAELVTPKTKLIIINFPHNPTGSLPTTGELEQIAGLAAKYGIIIFSDEMYHRLVFDPKDHIPALCDMYENAISLWGMAKSFGLAGLRLGWLAGKRRDILQRVLSFKDYLSICNNAAGEVLASITLKNSELFLEPNIEKIVRNQKIFADFAARNKGLLSFTPTKAGSTALIGLKNIESAFAYSETLVREAGIMLVPSEMFDYGDKHVRIGFGRANMPEALKVWQQYIDSGDSR